MDGKRTIDRKMKHTCSVVIAAGGSTGAFSLSASGDDYVLFGVIC